MPSRERSCEEMQLATSAPLRGRRLNSSPKEKTQKTGPSAKALAETDIQLVLAKGSGTREKRFGSQARAASEPSPACHESKRAPFPSPHGLVGSRWLKKALQQVQDGELPASEVYNILKASIGPGGWACSHATRTVAPGSARCQTSRRT